jgi:hypothetical protein
MKCSDLKNKAMLTPLIIIFIPQSRVKTRTKKGVHALVGYLVQQSNSSNLNLLPRLGRSIASVRAM